MKLKNKGQYLIIVLLIVSNLILLALVIVGNHSASDANGEHVEKQMTYEKPTVNWEKAFEYDVFGEETDESYYQYKFDMKLPTGNRSGNMDAIFKIKEKVHHDPFYDYIIVISPDTLNMPKCSYGDFLYLWYKEDGGEASDYLMMFYFSEDGYHAYPKQLGNERKISHWIRKHKLVKFKGFTSDYINATRFEESPNGIGREGTDVFINPEFSIQF